MDRPTASAPWRSFWMAGFEGADHVNGEGRPLDMHRASGHLERLNEDHARCAALGLRTLRESVGWRLAEPAPGRWNFERMLQIAHSARHHGLQVLWSLMHYGMPPDLNLFDDRIIERFAAFAGEAAARLATLHDEPPVYTLINEIGFLAWAASASQLLHSPPGQPQPAPESSALSGYAVKRRLVQATLAAMQAVRRADPRARFLQVEPLVHVVAPHGQPERQPEADAIARYQWQVWDLLAGRVEPELGGHEAALDLIGVNHYHSGQWELGSERRLAWHLGDVRRRRPAGLMQACWQRYGRPMIVAETSHIGARRCEWLHHMAAEVAEARRLGVPVEGLCLYPAVDRPDWEREAHWHNSGLWDVDPTSGADGRRWQRLPHREYLATLARWQAWLPNRLGEMPGSERPPKGMLVVLTQRRWRSEPGRLTRLMCELAGHWQVLVVEPPRHEALPPWIEHVAQGPRLDLLVPHSPLPGEAFDAAQCALLAPLLQQALQAFPGAAGARRPIVWFDTAAARPLANALAPCLLVDDCEVPTPAPPAESPGKADGSWLLADRGGDGAAVRPPVWRTGRARDGSLPWLLPAVDAAAHALGPDASDSSEGRFISTLLSGIGVPRLVYIGSVDHRLDETLLRALSSANERWQLLLVGPGPRHEDDALQLQPLSNLHRLPALPQALLPHLLQRCHLGLLPLRLAPGSGSARHQPPQVLEYLAGGLPVVATAVPGLQSVPGNLLRVADSSASFIDACEAALAERGTQREARRRAALSEARRCSWSRAAARVDALLQAALRRAGEMAHASGPALTPGQSEAPSRGGPSAAHPL